MSLLLKERQRRLSDQSLPREKRKYLRSFLAEKVARLSISSTLRARDKTLQRKQGKTLD
jgi:hypothetical protein